MCMTRMNFVANIVLSAQITFITYISQLLRVYYVPSSLDSTKIRYGLNVRGMSQKPSSKDSD